MQGDGTGLTSIYGAPYADESFRIAHNTAMLSMVGFCFYYMMNTLFLIMMNFAVFKRDTHENMITIAAVFMVK